ncbi:MAG: prenyltransferase/squalene oxidase repeat-containing protein [Planctomycetaceae bacterium]
MSRRVLTLCFVGLSAWAGPAACFAQSATVESTGKRFYTPRTARAVDAALAHLAKRQQSDGSFGSGRFRGNVAVTALSGMAFLAAGHTPGRGKYGKVVRDAVEYILDRTRSNGYIVEKEVRYHGPMYGHGFATMFLSEVYGSTHSRTLKMRLKTKLRLAVNLIVSTQNKNGGWRYKPDSTDADVSVTVCQVMALRAARNSGVYVSKTGTIDPCIAYLKRCQNKNGGFRYQTTVRVNSLFPRSAAGVVALYSAGIYKGKEISAGLNYLRRFVPRGTARKNSHYYYGQYYAVQAMWHAGGDDWRAWYPAIRDELLADQEGGNRWQDEFICDEYGTAMACLILQMPVNYLPIFQR